MQVAYRWLRESFVALREQGFSVEDAQAELGYVSPLVLEWDKRRTAGGDGRHHRRVEAEVEGGTIDLMGAV